MEIIAISHTIELKSSIILRNTRQSFAKIIQIKLKNVSLESYVRLPIARKN